MDTVTRRRFLIASGVTGAAALAAGAAATMTPQVLAGRSVGAPLPSGKPVLVVLQLYGGNDGLNTLIPYADKAYQDGRPHLAYDEGEVLKLGEGLGLNPAMKGMAKRFSFLCSPGVMNRHSCHRMTGEAMNTPLQAATLSRVAKASSGSKKTNWFLWVTSR